MQRSTPKYKIKKSKQTQIQSAKVFLIVVTSIIKESFFIIAKTHENDGNSQLLMITSWIELMKLTKILFDDDSMMKLINRLKLHIMISRSRIYNDKYFWINLTTDAIHILTKYVYLFVNIIEIEAIIKAWIVEN